MFAGKLYTALGAAPDAKISARFTHSGLAGRTLKSAFNRWLSDDRKSHDRLSELEIRAMKRALVIGIATLLLATSAAHAGNCRSYKCGKVEIGACIYKEDGKPAGRQIVIYIPLEVADNEDDERKKLTSGLFVYREIDSPVGYFLSGKRYRCKEQDGPPSQWSDEWPPR